MIIGATDGLPSREESERLLARGTVDASRVYEQHMLAALLRIEALLGEREEPAPAPAPKPKRKRATRKATR